MRRPWAKEGERRKSSARSLDSTPSLPPPPLTHRGQRGNRGAVIRPPPRGGAATEEEREELVTKGLEGYLKELEFYHLFQRCVKGLLSTPARCNSEHKTPP